MRTVAGGATARFDIEVFDSSDAAVTGLVTSNFTKYLTTDGANDATSVTVTEVANGRYTVTFAAPAVSAGSAKYVRARVIHATYGPRGWAEDFEVYNEVVLAQAVAAIKAKTDLIPASPAAVGSAMTLATGAVTADAVATGAIDADALAADAGTEIANAVLAAAIESGVTLLQATRIIAAFAGGKSAGMTSTGGTAVFDAAGNPGTPRISSPLDTAGNRTSVTLTP